MLTEQNVLYKGWAQRFAEVNVNPLAFFRGSQTTFLSLFRVRRHTALQHDEAG